MKQSGTFSFCYFQVLALYPALDPKNLELGSPNPESNFYFSLEELKSNRVFQVLVTN